MLCVWLPLTGDLHNQGLSGLTATNNGATVNNNGKIGKCYQMDGSHYITIASKPWMSMKPAYNFSLFLWVKGTTTGWLIAAGGWELRLCPTFIKISLSGNGQYPANLNQSFDTNTWYHLGFTWNGGAGELKLYLNGSCVATSNVPSSANFSVNSSLKFTYDGPRYLNDIRIYDHCLSAKEVEEIAKGLVLHYQLNDPYIESTTNLFKPKPCTGGENWIASGNGVKIDWAANAKDTYWYLQLADGVTLVRGDTYTFSCRCSGIGTTTVMFRWCNSAGYDIYLHNGWNQYTFSMPSRNITHPFLDDVNRDASLSNLQIYDFQLEKKGYATPYTSSTRNLNIIYDSSGYNNNGTIIGSLETTTPSPRYSCAILFTKGRDEIQSNLNPNFITTGSISLWVKVDSLGSSGWLPFTGDTTGKYLLATSNGTGNFYNGTVTAAGTIKYYEDGNQVTAPTGLTTGWHHIVITGINLSSWTTLHINNYGGVTATAWNSTVKYSDIRFYNTILTAAQIKELYNTSMTIDNQGNIHARELVE